MRNFGLIFGLIATLVLGNAANAAGPGFQGECWVKTFYFYGPSGKGGVTGKSAGNAWGLADRDIMSIEAGTLITGVEVIIDAAVTGSVGFDIGDDDDADGFCPRASLTLGTPGVYCGDTHSKGVYLKNRSGGDAAAYPELYAVPAMKYYSASGKEIKIDNFTTTTAGTVRVVVHGCKVGA